MSEQEAICKVGDCESPAIMAIRTTNPRGRGLVHTVWQDDRDAPKSVSRYCGQHGVHLAANLAVLADSALRVTVYVEEQS